MIDQIHPNLLRQALQLGRNGRRALYERLEFLGDRVVGLVVAEMLYTTFPGEREGALAKRFVALTREETLARVGEQIGLPERIITRDDSLRHNSSVLCDVCEAVLGAMYMDLGLEAVKKFMYPLWTPLIQEEITIPQDAKSALQEWAQKKYKKVPEYQMESRTGPDHCPHFVMRVTIENYTAVAEGSSKRIAEQIAAETLLEQIRQESQPPAEDASGAQLLGGIFS